MEFTDKRKKITKRAVFWIIILAVCYLVMLLFGFFSFIRMSVFTIWGAALIYYDVRLLKKPEFVYNENDDKFNILKNLAAIAAFAFFTSYPYLTVCGISKYQYVFSKMYVNKLSSYSRELLPDKLPDEISDYYFEYFPGCLQADSWLKFDFTTNPDGIAEIREYAEDKSVAVLDLEMYRNDKENEQVTAFKKSYFKPNERGYTADYFFPRTGKAGEEEGRGEIYIFESNGNWNHPHTVCITINYDKDTVSFNF